MYPSFCLRHVRIPIQMSFLSASLTIAIHFGYFLRIGEQNRLWELIEHLRMARARAFIFQKVAGGLLGDRQNLRVVACQSFCSDEFNSRGIFFMRVWNICHNFYIQTLHTESAQKNKKNRIAQFSCLLHASVLPECLLTNARLGHIINQSEFSDILRSMTKRAENQIRKRIEAAGEPSQIEQLCLDGIEIKNITPNIKKLLETCTHLEYLTLNDCSLKSLEHFPALRSLIVLQLSDNQLTGEDFAKLTVAPQINFLTIDSNKISESSLLSPLSALRELEILQIHDNPLTSYLHYRQEIFRLLPNLKAVDCQDRTGNTVKEQDPSEYFSYKEPRSRIDLTDLIDDDDEEPNRELPSNRQTRRDYLEEGRDSGETNHSARGSFYASNRNVRRYHSDIMNIRTSIQDESDSEEKDMMRDFRKKFHKKE